MNHIYTNKPMSSQTIVVTLIHNSGFIYHSH